MRALPPLRAVEKPQAGRLLPVPAVVLTSSREVQAPAGEVLFHQDDAGDTAYLVVTGKVKVSQHASNGTTNVLAILGPGDVFGELSLFDAGPRSATAQTVSATTLRALDRSVLDTLLLEQPDVATWMMQELARRLRRATNTASDLVFCDVPARVAAALLNLAEQFGCPAIDGSIVVDHGLTQVELAQLAGSTRESVNKALSGFSARQWIAVSPGSTRICDVASLTRRARRGETPGSARGVRDAFA